MKKIKFNLFKMATLLMVVVLIASCQKYKKEIVELNFSKDSIQEIADVRNNQVLDYIISFNEIQQNLDSIKRVQKLLDVNMSGGFNENQKTEKEKILDDIAMINNLLNQNKSIVASLQKKLKDSNLKSKELEQMIQSYVLQIEEKDGEIAKLNLELANLKIDITGLNQKIEQLAEESNVKSSTIEAQKDQMNLAYYCFGTKDELVENGVIEKTGGFIGIGKTIKVKTDFNHDYFTKIDQRNFSEVVIMAPKAKLLTIHPESSYHFNSNEKLVENLTIDQPNEFWKASKYMIILVEQ